MAWWWTVVELQLASLVTIWPFGTVYKGPPQ